MARRPRSGGAHGDAAACGELIRAYRERHGLSQEELAQRAEVSDRTIRNVESGARLPRRATLQRLATVLELADHDRRTLLAAWQGQRRPCSLPADIPDFVGRHALLASVVQTLAGGRGVGVGAVCVLAGMGGVGKTTLAVRAAHQLAGHYPDGQLYTDLRGTRAEPVPPEQALARLLGRLGVPAANLPLDLDARSELLRDRLSDRRVLLILDDVAAEAQIRPLLPGGGSAVLATSRNRLSGLAGAHLFQLAVPDHDEARGLLTAVIGHARAASAPHAAAAIVELCGRLPLAVRIIGAVLAGRPDWPLTHAHDLLADERERLGVLQAGDLGVAASISLSYQVLGDQARRAFHRLAILDAPDFAAWTAAAVLEVSLRAAHRFLEQLVDAYLLEISGIDPAGQIRYRFHELVRVYARYHGTDEATDAQTVLARTTAASFALARLAAQRMTGAVRGTVPDAAGDWEPDEHLERVVTHAPDAWLDAELAGIVATVEQAVGHGLIGAAHNLAACVIPYCSLHCQFDACTMIAEAIADAARSCGLADIEAAATLSLADALAEQGELARARPLIRSALRAAARGGMASLEARARLSLAIIDRSTGDRAAARRGLLRAAECAVLADDRLGRAYALAEIGAIDVAAGDLEEAERHFREARPVFQEYGELRGETRLVLRLAGLEQARGSHDAASRFHEALALAERCDDVRAANEIRYRLGLLLLRDGKPRPAAALLVHTASHSRELGDARGSALANEALGRAYTQLAEPDAARRAYESALSYYRRMGLDKAQQTVLELLAEMREVRT